MQEESRISTIVGPGLRRWSVLLGLLGALLLVPAAVADNAPVDHFLLGPVAAHGPAGAPGLDGQLPPGLQGKLPPGLIGKGGPGRPPAAGQGGAGTTANLTYHNGAVMRTNTTYAIYWSPASAPLTSAYQELLSRFFGDVASASGSSSNVYATDTQYYDTTGSISYASVFGGSTVYSAPIPANPACVGQYASQGLTVGAGCVLDSDIESAVSAAIASAGWTPGPNSEFFLFTPQNVGSCFSTSGNYCAYNYYCAYHSSFSSGGQTVIYANQPYTDTSGVLGYQSCSAGQFPNGNWADATINVTSHEHNEAITDPYGTAWYDSQGAEDGDKCAWNFGTVQGSNGAEYNQTINGDHFFLQQEWSNASSGCALGYSPPAPPSISTFTPTSGPTGTQVTLTGAGFTGATSVTFGSAAATFSVVSSTTITATVPSAATNGAITVTTPLGTATSSSAFTVTAPPDFSISVSPTQSSVRHGQSVKYTVSITRGAGFAGTVQLAVAGLPGGASGSFSPGSIVSPGLSSTLNVSTRNNTRGGTYTLTVTATSGTLKHSFPVTLTVT